MIKADVTVFGTVVQGSQVKQTAKGYILTAAVRTSVPQKEGGMQDVLVSVSAPQTASAGIETLVQGQRVSLSGALHFHKIGEVMYLNMNVVSCTQADPSPGDGISGELHMIGFLGSRAPEVRTGKGGKPFMNFSAYSGDGDGENRSFTWVRFIRFSGDVEPFLVPKALVKASGTMELQFFQGKLSISCRLSQVSPYEKKPGTGGTIAEAPADAPF